MKMFGCGRRPDCSRLLDYRDVCSELKVMIDDSGSPGWSDVHDVCNAGV